MTAIISQCFIGIAGNTAIIESRLLYTSGITVRQLNVFFYNGMYVRNIPERPVDTKEELLLCIEKNHISSMYVQTVAGF